MKELNIKSASLRGVRRFLGVLAILAAIAWLAGHLKELRLFDVLYFISFVLLGLVNLTDGFGQERTLVTYENGTLSVKWFYKFRAVRIKREQIESIGLKRFEVQIRIKGERPLNLSLDNFETAHKKEIYEFFIELCSSENIDLIRSFDRLTVES